MGALIAETTKKGYEPDQGYSKNKENGMPLRILFESQRGGKVLML